MQANCILINSLPSVTLLAESDSNPHFYPSPRFSRISHLCLYFFSLFVDLNTSRSLHNFNGEHLHASHSPVSSDCWGKTCRSVWAASSPSPGSVSRGGGSSLRLRALRCGTAVRPRKLRPRAERFPSGRCNWTPTARSRSWTASGRRAPLGWESSMRWRRCWRCWCDPAPARWLHCVDGPLSQVQLSRWCWVVSLLAVHHLLHQVSAFFQL